MSEAGVLVDKIARIMDKTTRKVWEEIETEENLNSGKDLKHTQAWKKMRVPI